MRGMLRLLAVVSFAGITLDALAVVPLLGATTVTGGGSHTCALTTGGGARCWGGNAMGQLGDNTTTDRLMPVDVSGLASGVIAIDAGKTHTCALTSSGGVKCWGDNTYGQLGDNTTTNRLTPVDVSGLTSGVVAISAGQDHSCALTSAGGVKCWGYNSWGQLGDGSFTQRLTPVSVSGLTSGVTAIGSSTYFSCALTTAGGLKCWGYNGSGQLGDNTTSSRSVPADVTGLTSGVTAFTTGGGHTCALSSAGGVKCWGKNTSGQLGDGTSADKLTATNVTGLASGVAKIDGGGTSTCALVSGGGVKCWGNNFYGQVGNGTTSLQWTPVDVIGLADSATAIAAGTSHNCALLADSRIQCWGYNVDGQLGDNTAERRSTPVAVSGLGSGVQSVALGSMHTCAVVSGAAQCWGENSAGQLGDASVTDRQVPVGVSGLFTGMTATAPGGIHSCALTAAGGVKCFGSNNFGQLGNNSTFGQSTPVDVTGLGSGVTAIASGYSFSCALTSGGGVKCWGRNNNGQLGDNSILQRSVPVDVSGLTSGAAAVATGGGHTCAVTTGGAAKCWGSNVYGQIGDNATTTRLVPVAVSGLTGGVTAITTGDGHTCALVTGGAVKCWGDNTYGQLGDNTTTRRLTPVSVSGLASGVTAIAAGGSHTCALTSGGAIKCWGDNTWGQLGDGTTASKLVPVDASGLATGAAGIAAGQYHNCARTTDGGLKCWGRNTVGEIGDGSAGFRMWAASVMVSSGALLDQAIGVIASVPTTLTYSNGGTFTVSATGGGSGNPVTFTSKTAGVCTTGGANGSTVTKVAAGTCTLAADQAGNASYNPAPQITQNFAIGQASQTIGTITTTPSTVTYSSGGTFALSATGGASGNPVTFSSQTTGVCTTGGANGATVTTVAVGTCVVTGNQAGNANYAPAPEVTQAFAINQPGQTIGTITSTPSTLIYSSGGTFTVSATGGASGNPVVFSSQTIGTCATGGVNGATVTMFAAGTCTLSANQAGNGTYAPAPQVTQNFSIGRANQTIGAITSAPSPLTYSSGGTFTVSATGGASGNPVTFSSQTTGVCTSGGLNGATLTMLAAGTCTVAANQAGNANYNPATQVTQNFALGLASQTIGTISSVPSTLTYSSGGTFTVSATGGASGNPVAFTSQTALVCTTGGVNGATVTMVTAGTCTIAANQAGNGNYNPAPQVTQNFALGLASQTIGAITSTPATLTYSSGGTFTVSATGGASGNPVTFTSQTAPVCTTGGVNGATVTMVIAGTCTVAANQTGNVNYNPAPQVTQAFVLEASSTTSLATSNGVVPVGASVTLTAEVTGFGPTGTVSFKIGPAMIDGCGAAALTGNGNSLTAQCATGPLPVGGHILLATYGGDAINAPSAGSVVQTVIGIDAPTLDVDASITTTKYDALTDGLLTIRYLFGLTGSSLTTGALGSTATRIDPDAIKAYLDGIRPALDIDDDGTVDALTDGLLITRYLFGLRGDPLIAGAVGPLAKRKTAPDIEAYLQTLMP